MSAPNRSDDLPQLHDVAAVAGALKISRRKLERLRSRGDFPKPDIVIGRAPRWRAETVSRWLAESSRNVV